VGTPFPSYVSCSVPVLSFSRLCVYCRVLSQVNGAIIAAKAPKVSKASKVAAKAGAKAGTAKPAKADRKAPAAAGRVSPGCLLRQLTHLRIYTPLPYFITSFVSPCHRLIAHCNDVFVCDGSSRHTLRVLHTKTSGVFSPFFSASGRRRRQAPRRRRQARPPGPRRRRQARPPGRGKPCFLPCR
jgi:hypothetical protein